MHENHILLGVVPCAHSKEVVFIDIDLEKLFALVIMRFGSWEKLLNDSSGFAGSCCVLASLFTFLCMIHGEPCNSRFDVTRLLAATVAAMTTTLLCNTQHTALRHRRKERERKIVLWSK